MRRRAGRFPPHVPVEGHVPELAVGVVVYLQSERHKTRRHRQRRELTIALKENIPTARLRCHRVLQTQRGGRRGWGNIPRNRNLPGLT